MTDMFCENGYDRKTFQKIINNFEKKTPQQTFVLMKTS